MSFQQALSGLNGATQNLDTIGNNVANASTVGFKDARAQFSDVYAASMSGGGETQIGIGTKLAAVSPQFTQGNIETTGNPMDLAINGQGFFRLETNGIPSFTRDGEFQLDKNGYVVTASGSRLTGYTATAQGTVSPATPTDILLNMAPIAPKSTANASLSVNLDSRQTTPSSAFSLTDSTTYNASTAMTTYDSLGNSHTLSVYFRTTSANNWDVYAASDGTLLNPTATPPGKIGSLAFNSSGTFTGDVSMPVSIPLANGATSPLTFPLLFPAATTSQYGVAFSSSKNSQDGYTTGQLAGFTVGSDGTVIGSYTNGQTRTEAQVALANFINPQGLAALGNNQWQQTSDSGAPLLGPPGTGSNGVLQSGALEQSNVDLTKELVNMITAQRVYQANAETIKVEDQVQQTLVSLR